jgi:hypothetical protein
MKRFPLVFVIAASIVLFSLISVAQQTSGAAPANNAQQAGAAAAPGKAPSDQAQQEKATGTSAPLQAPPQKQSPETGDANDPLFGLPPLPKGKVSLIGGTVQKVDRLRNRVKLKTFGDDGKSMTVAFDERSHIYRDGVETTERGIRQGDRVYVDTMLDTGKLFARNIRVVTNLKPTDAQGQIVSYNPGSGLMTVRDDLSATPVTFRLTKDTVVKSGGGQGAMELVPGSLVSVRFSADKSKRDLAREISILAVPGSMFTFVGKVRHLDLRSGMLAVENTSDNKTYELHFEPGVVRSDVTVGTDVTVSAMFSGREYKARRVAVNTARE